jgi:hypothetical protein
MIGLFMALALVVALTFSGRRLYRRMRLRRALLALPGARSENAVVVGSFEEVDAETERRRCPCGGRYDVRGESSRETDGRRLRVIGLECRFCEKQVRLFFDVTGLLH